jgi:ABC-type multidrug transport system ATPase subunit
VTATALELREVARQFRRRGSGGGGGGGGGSRAVVRAVDGVSLSLVPGEIVALVGPNGAGKTTLLRLAAGLLRPDAGTISVGEAHAPAGSPAARRALGFAPDEPVFPPALTVREVLDYYARFHAPGSARRGLVAAALELSGLGEVVGRRAAALSQGYARRLALAQAALGGRRVLLLDETLSAADPVVRRALCEGLQQLAARGVAVLLSSHDLTTVERLAVQVLVMARGRVVRTGSLAALLRERVLEVVLEAPPAVLPPGFRATPAGLEMDLGTGSVEAALAVCRAHRLAVRASRVRLKSLEDVILEAVDDATR